MQYDNFDCIEETTHETYFRGIPRIIGLFSDPPALPPGDILEPEGASTGAADGKSGSRLCEKRDTV